MKATFNLIAQPWIPCITRDGTTVELGLADALSQAHEMRSLEGDSPLETASLIRLMLAVLHRVIQTDNPEDWMAVWEAGRFDSQTLKSYFQCWKDRFDLFDEVHPFYQQRHTLVDPWSAIKLLPGMSAVPLYYHAVETGDVRYSPSKAARILVSAHTFATPGTRNPQKNLYFNGGPWLSGKVFFLEGDNLFQTLLLNLLQYGPNHPNPNLGKTAEDAPAWEKEDPFQPDRAYPLGYLDYLTWQNRRVCLIPVEEDGQLWVKEVVEAPGLHLNGEIRDPMKVYIADEKKGLKMLYLNESKALWRESPTFLDTRSKNIYPPQALRWAADLAVDYGLPATLMLRLMAVGVVVENNSKIVLHRMERMPLPLRFLNDPDLFVKVRQEVELAEKVKDKIFYAVNTLASLMIASLSDLSDSHSPSPDDVKNLRSHWRWEENYWPPLELAFYSLLQDLPADPQIAILNWRKTLQKAAWDALDTVIQQVGDSPHALKAAVQARGALGGGLLKLGISERKAQLEQTQ